MAPEYFPDHSPEHVGCLYTQMVKRITQKSIVKKQWWAMGLKVLPWVVEGAGGLGAGKTSGAGTRGVSLDVVIGGRTGYSDTNGGESSNN